MRANCLPLDYFNGPDKESPREKTLRYNFRNMFSIGSSLQRLSGIATSQPAGEFYHKTIIKNIVDEMGQEIKTTSFANDFLEAASLYLECQEPGWDGYEAFPLSRESMQLTSRFLIALPRHIPRPTLVPEPSGEIGMNWRKGKTTVTMSINANGIISFAGLTGAGAEVYGSIPFKEEIPQELLSLVTTFCE